MIDATEPMRAAKKFGAFLLQLSPAFTPRRHNLAELEELARPARAFWCDVELRNRNWMEGEELEETLDFFRRQKATLTLVDAPNEEHFTIMPSIVDEVTDPRLAYLRLHGRDPKAYLQGKTVAERFFYDYSDEEIDEIAARAKKLAGEADKVHVIFNNNARDFAPHAAARLRAALGQITKTPPDRRSFFVSRKLMAPTSSDETGAWARFQRWLSGMHLRVMAIEDTPHSIALGLAIGIFFGFTPLWSLKTLLSIAVAWLLGSNKIAAAISVQLHDLILPFMPAIYLWEYKLGFWVLHRAFPRRAHFCIFPSAITSTGTSFFLSAARSSSAR